MSEPAPIAQRLALEPARDASPQEPNRRRPTFLASARTRVLAAFVILLALSTGVSLLLEREILRSQLSSEIDREMAQEVREFRRLVAGNDPRTGKPFGADLRAIFDVYLSRNVPDEGEAILSYVGGRRYKSIRALDRQDPVDELFVRLGGAVRSGATERGEIETSAGTARYLAVPVVAAGRTAGTFVVANFPRDEQAEVDSAVELAFQISAVIFLIALGIAWVAAGRVLVPLRLLSDTARSITESDLTRRIPTHGRDEVAQLGATFNEMLDRLESAFATQRRFLDDAGHELRTPITIVRGHLELLESDPVERAETIALVLEELDRMARIVNDLVVLAKSEEPGFLEIETVDVAELTDKLEANVSALTPRAWTVESRGVGVVAADRQRLAQAVLQLAHNAVRYTADGDPLALGSAVADGNVRFWVRDGGPGIPIEEQARIFERFSRGGHARGEEGAGLGLSIIKAIAEAHGGRVEVESRPGRGATFTIVIPEQRAEPGR